MIFVGVLVPCAEKVVSFKKKYQALAEGKLLVGISWRSTRVDHRRATLKSTDLKRGRYYLKRIVFL